MQAKFVKGEHEDTIFIDREDRSQVQLTFPKKGVIPHDAVHLVVEQALGFSTAFWGRIADGEAPASVAELARLGGHASAKRAEVPDGDIVELVQAERAVECFEAEMWSSPAEPSVFRAVLDAACRQSKVPSPAVSSAQIEQVRRDLGAFRTTWDELPQGGSATLVWHQHANQANQ